MKTKNPPEQAGQPKLNGDNMKVATINIPEIEKLLNKLFQLEMCIADKEYRIMQLEFELDLRKSMFENLQNVSLQFIEMF